MPEHVKEEPDWTILYEAIATIHDFNEDEMSLADIAHEAQAVATEALDEFGQFGSLANARGCTNDAHVFDVATDEESFGLAASCRCGQIVR